MHIAICDDDPLELERIQQSIHALPAESEVCLSAFNSGHLLWQEYLNKSHPFDMVILDIFMPVLDGMEMAFKIRERDSRVLIIFLTNADSGEIITKGFEVNAFRYLFKPIDQLKFRSALLDGFDKLTNLQERLFVVKTSDGIATIPAEEIMYLESFGHKKTVHTEAGTYSFTGSFLEAESFLRRFNKMEYASKGTLLNLAFVQRITKKGLQQAILRDGTALNVSRRNMKSLESSYLDYLEDTLP